MFYERRCKVLFVSINGLLRMLRECRKVDSHALVRPKSPMDQNRVIRVHMLRLHEPAFFVVSDRQDGETDALITSGEFVDEGAITSVPGEIDLSLRRINHKPAPERRVTAERRYPPGFMPGRHKHELYGCIWRLICYFFSKLDIFTRMLWQPRTAPGNR